MNPDKQHNLCIIYLFNIVSHSESSNPVSEEGLTKTAPARRLVLIYREFSENKHILY